MTISFVNPGEIDITSLEVMGLSAKEHASPIGRFGTGLKYAVAITLRLGGKIAIWSGERCYLFETEKLTFRGKEVSRVVISEDGSPFRPLPFTLDYGQDWKPWQAMRELKSNCRDEQGSSHLGKAEPRSGHTTIWLSCPEIEEAYSELNKYFITSKPFTSTDEADIHHWPHGQEPSTKIFYRGVYVGDFEKPSLFMYNFKSGITLSEDRMIQSWVPACLLRSLTWCVIQGTNRDYIEKCLTLGSGYAEGDPDLPTPSEYGQPIFTEVLNDYIDQNRAALLNIKYLHWHYKATKKDELLYDAYTPTHREAMMLEQVKFVLRAYFKEMPEINLVEQLPAETIGVVAGDRIYISRRAFSMGEGMLLGTIYEELCHWKYKHIDESRGFQNHLVDQIATLMLELHFYRNERE